MRKTRPFEDNTPSITLCGMTPLEPTTRLSTAELGDVDSRIGSEQDAALIDEKDAAVRRQHPVDHALRDDSVGAHHAIEHGRARRRRFAHWLRTRCRSD